MRGRQVALVVPAVPRVLFRVTLGCMLVAVSLGVAGCFERGEEARVFVNGTEVAALGTVVPPASTSTVAALAFTPTPFTSDLDPEHLTGFALPIVDSCLPSRDEVMPNAPRPYRNGVHEGVDFYNGDVCTTVERGTQVLAMYDGVVIRADLDYTDITPQQVEALEAKTNAQGFSDPATLDVYRGRQIWIDHGNGIVSRYAHLSAIAEGIGVGVEVRRGQVIGAVGESGTPESLTAPGTELHLHAEVWIGDVFLGQGQPPGEVRRLYALLFSEPAPEAGTPAAPAATEPLREGTPGAGDEAASDGDAADRSAEATETSAPDDGATEGAPSEGTPEPTAAPE